MSEQSYPLSWPPGWKRTEAVSRQRSQFRKASRREGERWVPPRSRTVREALDELFLELERLGVRDWDVVVSSNLQVARTTGLPRSGQAEPKDPGVAVYFDLDGRSCVLACDRWDKVADNVYAIAKHIGALRGQDRWGVGSVEQAFAGYTALPETTSGESCWDVLGVDRSASRADVERAYRVRAMTEHPDQGGTDERMARLNQARSAALRNLEG